MNNSRWVVMVMVICAVTIGTIGTNLAPAADEPAATTKPVDDARIMIDVTRDLTRLGIHAQNAVGDGKTDNTSAIQAAIYHVAKSGGGTVLVPDGTYRIKEIVMVDGVRLMGAGVERTCFRTPEENFGVMIDVTGGSLENFTVYGTASAAGSGDHWKVGRYKKGKHRGGSTAHPVHIIKIDQAYNGAVLDNVRSLESRYDCLYVRGCKGLRVTNCEFNRAGRNIVSMVGSDEDFVFSNCKFGSLWNLYLFDMEPDKGRYVRDGLILNCLFDGRRAGEMDTNDRWGEFLCFKGHKELKSRNITVMGCTFHNVFVRVNHVLPGAKFLYNVFDNRFSDTQLKSLMPIADPNLPEVEWGMGRYKGEVAQDDKALQIAAHDRGRFFVRVAHNPVGEFRDAVVRGNRFLIDGKPAERINYGVAFTGKAIFEGNFPDKFNTKKPQIQTDKK